MIQTKDVVFKNFLSYPDLEIKQGEFTFIVGESGAGKTTLMRMINVSENVSSGNLLVDGVDIEEIDPIKQRQDFLLCGQSVYLFKGTIVDNFQKFYELRGLESPSIEKINEFLKLVVLDYDATIKVDSMSGGERQRVYLAIFISLAQKVIMLDEPTSALDDTSAKGLMTNLKAYAKENDLSVIIVSHAKKLVEEFADSVVDLSDVKRGEF